MGVSRAKQMQDGRMGGGETDPNLSLATLQSRVLLSAILRISTCLHSSHVTSSIQSYPKLFCHLQLHIGSNKAVFPCTLSFSLYQYMFLRECVLFTFLLILLSVETPDYLCAYSPIDSEFFTCFCFAKCFLFRNWHHRALQAKRYGSYF